MFNEILVQSQVCACLKNVSLAFSVLFCALLAGEDMLRTLLNVVEYRVALSFLSAENGVCHRSLDDSHTLSYDLSLVEGIYVDDYRHVAYACVLLCL